jgi:hypothetical protein
MTIVEDARYETKSLHALARSIFYFGALASFLDGLLTWWVVRSAGTNIERNSFMGTLMNNIGLVPTVVLRIAIGVFLFWYVSNIIVGRRMFLRQSKADKYQRFITKRDRSKWQQMFVDARPYITAMETVFILAVTWAVVGNNINAASVYFHHTH